MNKEEITINFVGITDYLRDKDIEIDNLKYANIKLEKKLQYLQNLIDKTRNYYLKTLNKNKTMPDEAIEMYNLLKENKG